LAVVPGAGGPPKLLAEDVLGADWSLNGDLAVVRELGTGSQLEFPVGVPVARSSGFILNPRVSPRGAAIAFVDRDDATLKVCGTSTGRVGVLCHASFPAGGIAWTPSGSEILFSRLDSIWSSTLSGERRLLYRGPGQILLQDTSPAGRILVYSGESRV